jgi:hypothetical protein
VLDPRRSVAMLAAISRIWRSPVEHGNHPTAYARSAAVN